MKKMSVGSAIAGLILMLGCNGGGQDPPGNGGEPGDDVGTITVCADGSDEICSYMPRDVTNPGNGYQGLSTAGQAHFDQFSWQAFVALNWPANSDGSASSATIGQDPTAARVWQYYSTAGDYFDPDGDSACPTEAAPVFELDSKISDTGRSTDVNEAFAAPLIDVNGNFAVFDIRVNDIWTTYVTGAQLRTYAEQQNFTGTVDFPEGCNAGTDNCATDGEIGAIEIKSSWMLVPEGEDFSDHYVLDGYISLDKNQTSTGEATCIQTQLALTGMHVVVRTATDGDAWIWGTFEHKDTAPFATTPLQPFAADTDAIPTEPAVTTCTASPDAGSTYSYFDSSCTTSGGGDCPVNTPPTLGTSQTEFVWNLSTPTQYASDYLVNGFGTQATRCWAIYEGTADTNTTWQGLLQGTVWANYELMGTQWQVLTDAPPPAPTNRIPAYLANATMETYFQTTQSCLSCHAQGNLAAQPKVSANFTWLLSQEVIDPSTGEVPPVPTQFEEIIEEDRESAASETGP